MAKGISVSLKFNHSQLMLLHDAVSRHVVEVKRDLMLCGDMPDLLKELKLGEELKKNFQESIARLEREWGT